MAGLVSKKHTRLVSKKHNKVISGNRREGKSSSSHAEFRRRRLLPDNNSGPRRPVYDEASHEHGKVSDHSLLSRRGSDGEASVNQYVAAPLSMS